MLDRASLTAEAEAYYDQMPLDAQVALEHSNLSFRTLDDLKSYESTMLSGLGGVLYQRLPEPAIPSNAALDQLDAE